MGCGQIEQQIAWAVGKGWAKMIHRHDHYIRVSLTEFGWAVEEVSPGAVSLLAQFDLNGNACESARRHGVALGLPVYQLTRIDLPEPEHVPF